MNKNISVIRLIRSENLMYNVTTVYNTVQLNFAKRVQLKYSKKNT